MDARTEALKLAPCPFCGHDTPYFERRGTPRQSCIVACGDCGARHESGDEGERSGSSWNTRAALAQAEQTAEKAQPVGTVQVMGSYRGVPALGCLLTKDAEQHLKPGDKLYAAPPAAPQPTGPLDDFGRPIVYDTEAIDDVTLALTGDEGEDDSVTVLERFAAYVQNVWPGKPALQALLEYEEKALAAAPQPQAAPLVALTDEYVGAVVRSVQPHLSAGCKAWRELTEQCRYWLEAERGIEVTKRGEVA